MEPEFRFSQQKAQELITILEFTTISQLAIKSEIYLDPNPSETIIKEDEDLLFMCDTNTQDSCPWVLRIEIDPKLLRRKPLRLKDITSRVTEECIKFCEMNKLRTEVDLIQSLEINDPIVLRLRFKNNIGNSFNYTKKLEQFLLEEMAIKGFCSKVSFKRSKLYEYSEEGVKKIEEREGEYVLETSGNQLKQVLLIPFVDMRRTYTNDIGVMIEIFGIEAGRLSILREIRQVFNHFGIYVNYRHIGLLSDIITSNGHLMPISRNGINKVYESPLRKCSFEQTVEVLIEAAVYAELDPLKGVSENIIMGQLCGIGTGSFDVIMDDNYLVDNKGQGQLYHKFKYIPDQENMMPMMHQEELIFGNGNRNNLHTPYVGLQTPAAIHTPMYNNYGQQPQTPQIFTPGGRFNKPTTPNVHNIQNSGLMSSMNNSSLYTPHRMDNNGYMSNNTGGIGNNSSGIHNPFSPMLDTNSYNRLNSPSNMNSRASDFGNIDSSYRNDIRYTPRTPNYTQVISTPYMRQRSPVPYNIEGQNSGFSSNSPYYSPNSNPLTSRSSGNMNRYILKID